MSTSESIANEDAKDLKVELGRDSQMAADEKPTIGEVEDDEVFHSGPGQADFRALGWYCSVLVHKIIHRTSHQFEMLGWTNVC